MYLQYSMIPVVPQSYLSNIFKSSQGNILVQFTILQFSRILYFKSNKGNILVQFTNLYISRISVLQVLPRYILVFVPKTNYSIDAFLYSQVISILSQYNLKIYSSLGFLYLKLYKGISLYLYQKLIVFMDFCTTKVISMLSWYNL